MARGDQPNPYQTPQSQVQRETVSNTQLALDKVSFDDELRACRFATELDDHDVIAALRTPLKNFVIRCAVMFLFGSLLSLVYLASGDMGAFILFLAFAVLYPGWIWCRGRYAGYRYLRKFPQTAGPIEGYVSPSRLLIKSNRGETEFLLPGLTFFRETPDYFLLSFHSAHATVVILPRRAFAPGDDQRVAGFIGTWRDEKRRRRRTILDRRLRQPPGFPPTTSPEGAVAFAGELTVGDVRTSAFGEQLRRVQTRLLLPLVVIELLLMGLGVVAVFYLRIPEWLMFMLWPGIVVGFVYLLAITWRMRAFRKPHAVLWYSRGWIHTAGVSVVVSLARTHYRWKAFESCGISEQAMALRIPGTARQFVLIGRNQFVSDTAWERASEIVMHHVAAVPPS